MSTHAIRENMSFFVVHKCINKSRTSKAHLVITSLFYTPSRRAKHIILITSLYNWVCYSVNTFEPGVELHKHAQRAIYSSLHLEIWPKSNSSRLQNAIVHVQAVRVYFLDFFLFLLLYLPKVPVTNSKLSIKSHVILKQASRPD